MYYLNNCFNYLELNPLIFQRKKMPVEAYSTSETQGVIQAELADAVREVTKQSQVFEASRPGIVVGSTIGPKRESNEDRVCAFTMCADGENGNRFVAVLCDGIGGERDGERSAADALAAFVAHCATSLSANPEEVLSGAVRVANDVVYAFTKGRGGTTLVAVLITADGRINGVNCGDSRIYKFSKSTGLKQLTTDQTVAAAIEQAGGSLPNDFLLHGFGENLGNFIGIGPDLSPEFITVDSLAQDEILILSSDGVWNALDTLFQKILQAAPTYAEAVRRILTVVNYSGGNDNASIAAFSPRAVLQTQLLQSNVHPGFIGLKGISPSGQINLLTVRSQTSRLAEIVTKQAFERAIKKQKVKVQKKPQQALEQSELPIEDADARSKSIEYNKKKRRPRVQIISEEAQSANTEDPTDKSS